MEKTEIGKYTKGFGLSFGITSVISAILVILKETNEGTILETMKSITGHHWVTHGVFNIILFLVLGWILSKANNGQGVNLSANSLVSSIIGTVVISSILIAGFYLIH
ncbi:MAG: hypothetical protein GXP56_11550 [Deltaproteobacteria bacterium]|nr:hypothetical protein [Deltaproteobacteria bacterium]